MGEYPRVRLQHVHDVQVKLTETTYTYTLHPIRVRRPARGHQNATVSCGACDVELDVRIYSARRTLVNRMLLFLVGLVSLAVLVILAVIGNPVGPSVAPLAIGGTVAWIVGVFCLVASFFYDGVRLPWFSGFRNGHVLRRPRRR